MEIIESKYQTKQWRNNCNWYHNGKKNECEKFQIENIKNILNLKDWIKTNLRLNIESNELKEIKTPLILNDGLEWTENFDGIILKNNFKFLFNLKFVCDKGGSQTRTLREVYHFIKCQIKYLQKNNDTNIYFINILDGNTSYEYMKYFNYLLNKKKYNKIKKYIIICDTFNFSKNISLIEMIQ